MTRRQKRRQCKPVPRAHYQLVDFWSATGALITGGPDLTDETLRVLASFVIADLRSKGAPKGQLPTAAEFITSLRELHQHGFMGVADNGRAYLSLPVHDHLGQVIDRVPAEEATPEHLKALHHWAGEQ